MSETPSESGSSPSGKPEAEVGSGEPKAPASGQSPSLAQTPKVNGEAHPVPDAGVPPARGADQRWSFGIGDVLDLDAKGRFIVKDRLGRGGMGEVYRAEYVAPLVEEPVKVFALKVLLPDADAHRQRIFRDEVRLLSLLRHESIARYHTSFVYNGRLVLVMEYVEGRSLHSLLRLAWSKGRFPSVALSLELVAQVAEALDYVHQAKDDEGRPLHIVHRDITPSNILVTEAGLAKVVDFGVAKVKLDGRTQTLTEEGLIKGKVPYLSPEQADHKPLDGRSDLFSLCCVLVEMLTAQPPFGRLPHVATLNAIADVTPLDVDRATRGLSDEVRAICQKALARDPAKRFATGHEMAQALLAQHECRGPSAVREEIEYLKALPDMSFEDVKKLAADLRRRNRNRRAFVAISGLLLVVATAFFAWSASRSAPPAPAPPPVAAVPNEQLMSSIPEQGTSPVNKEIESQTAPAVAMATPAKTIPDAGTRSFAKVVTCAGLMTAAGCVHVVKTGTAAGDCSTSQVPQLVVDGKPIPELMVQPDESNPEGTCRGPFDACCWRYDPCPVFEGPIVLKITGTTGIPFWDDHLADQPPNKRILLKGRAKFIDGKGTEKLLAVPGDPGSSREYEFTRRMTALITEMEMPDGTTVPVCGVLFDNSHGQPEYQRRRPVGIPIVTKDDKKPRTVWEDPVVRFFGLPP